MNLKGSLITALVLSIASIAFWEIYWRSQGYFPDLDEDKYLWAKVRSRVDNAGINDVVIVGSSRVLFGIQLEVWKKHLGVLPIQLSLPGSTPLPVFHDIVENTNFKGTILVGVTPPLFFSTTYPKAQPWERAASKPEFYKKRTYAQILNYELSIPVQNSFAFISDDEEGWYDDINLRALIKKIQLPDRTKTPKEPPFYRFQDIDVHRNVRMKDRVATDTAFAGTVKNFWKFVLMADNPPPDKESTMAYFLKDLEKFKARGGKVILLRMPSSGLFHEVETKYFSRVEYWDILVQKAGVPAYHYTDFETLTGYPTYEWSHLTGPDADQFTEELIKILIKDNVLTNSTIH